MITVYDESNYKALLAHHDEKVGDSTFGVHVANGEKRFLSYRPTISGNILKAAAPPYSASFPVFPRSDWSAMIKEQKERKRRISDFQYFAPHDQDGLPTCWANGPAHAGTTMRVIQGLPLIYWSACSAAVPISGGHSGGDEWDAGMYFQKYGAAPQDLWANNDTSRSLNSDNRIVAARSRYMMVMVFRLNSFDEFASAALMDPPMTFAVAFNWWSHVISGGDLVEIEPGSFGMMYRNNWGSWGDNNDLGQPGYITMREGHGTPDSGFCIGPVTSSVPTIAA
jgi:hypothetical protein